MIFIFIMSHSNGLESENQSNFIVNFINNILKLENTEVIGIIIRKLAHLFEYFVLGILMFNCLKGYNIKRIILISLVLCSIYAITDEIHQLYIPGRSGNLIDVMIDAVGSVIGIILYNFMYKKLKYKYCKNNI